MWKDTVVVWMGEFGRTPRINQNGGRDHWGRCWSVVVGGGAIKGGVVYGSTEQGRHGPGQGPGEDRRPVRHDLQGSGHRPGHARSATTSAGRWRSPTASRSRRPGLIRCGGKFVTCHLRLRQKRQAAETSPQKRDRLAALFGERGGCVFWFSAKVADSRRRIAAVAVCLSPSALGVTILSAAILRRASFLPGFFPGCRT